MPLFVPVGEDQESHVEFSRQLVNRFNFHYGFSLLQEALGDKNVRELLSRKLNWNPDRSKFPKLLGIPDELNEEFELQSFVRREAKRVGFRNFEASLEDAAKFVDVKELLTEPQSLLTPTPRIPGLDGRKMSKSYGNAITLSESDADIYAKTKVMVTDPARKRRTDPGNPDVCPVYDWHKLFSNPERDPGRLEWVRTGCTTAGIGCIECKKAMADNLIKWIEPVRARRIEYEQHPKRALEILDAGSAKAHESAKQTMARVRESIFHWNQKRRELST
jgi:tryptophanyl-tRNA synthetase